MTEPSETSRKFITALLQMDEVECEKLIHESSLHGGGVLDVEGVVVPALEQIGQDWEEGRISLSQVYMAGRICERVVGGTVQADHPFQHDRPRLAIGVLEDYHALGKRMVMSVLRSAGYGMLDYGHGLKAADLVERVLRDRVDILLISCLMLTSAVRVKDVVDGLKLAGSGTVVVVGGAPFRLDPQLWREVGAQYVGHNSGEAVRIVQRLREDRIWE